MISCPGRGAAFFMPLRGAGTATHTTVILRSVPYWARVSKDGHTHFVSILRDAAQARGSSG